MRKQNSIVRILGKIALLPVALFLLVAVVQICGFVYFAKKDSALAQADLIVTFPGGGNRVATTWELVGQGLAPNLAIINSTERKLYNTLQKHKNLEPVILHDGGTSRSTFEDVYIATKIIEQHNFTSAILITSSYHMPRALFLLKAHLTVIGRNVRIRCAPVDVEKHRSFTGKMVLYYKEIVKMWGSVVELVVYHSTKTLFLDAKQVQDLKEKVHKYLLFGS